VFNPLVGIHMLAVRVHFGAIVGLKIAINPCRTVIVRNLEAAVEHVSPGVRQMRLSF